MGRLLPAPISSLQLGVMTEGMTSLGVTWSGAEAPALPENDALSVCRTLQRSNCNDPAASLDQFALANLPAFARVQIVNVVAALVTGATRSISLSLLDVRSQATLSALGVQPPTYQEIAEHSGTPEGRPAMLMVQRWFASIFADLLDRLDSTAHADGGTLLDHTVVLWISDSGEASIGSGQSIPVVIAGNVDHKLRTGRAFSAGASQVALLRTIQFVLTRRMDIGSSALVPGTPLITPLLNTLGP
jgi:hypothetical protein